MAGFKLKYMPSPVLRLEPKNETGDFNAENGKLHLLNPAGATMNITLPAPSASLHIVLKEMTGDESKTITVLRNGVESIDGVAANITIDSSKESVTLISDGTDWYRI